MSAQNKVICLLAFLLLFSGVVFAQNETVLPNPGITPESWFYFLDTFGEELREFFTFSSEGRARLQITFAAERVAEIKIILEERGVDAGGLAVAQSRLVAHLADAAAILADEKEEGNDVSRLAKELDDEFEDSQNALEETFKAEKTALKIQKDELKEKLKEARRVGDAAQVGVLLKQLGEVKVALALLERKEEEQEDAFEDEEERIEEAMEDKTEAEKKIRKAEREKQEVLDEAAKEGISLPSEAFNAFDKHISEAKSALVAGKFEEAKHHAEEAKEGLETIEDAIEDLEEAQEEEDELKEEQEEKEREAKEEDEEFEKEEAEQAAERLEKEVEKAREEAKKAEERLRKAGEIDEDDDEDDED